MFNTLKKVELHREVVATQANLKIFIGHMGNEIFPVMGMFTSLDNEKVPNPASCKRTNCILSALFRFNLLETLLQCAIGNNTKRAYQLNRYNQNFTVCQSLM